MSIVTPPNEYSQDRNQNGNNLYDKYSYRSPNNHAQNFKASEPKKLLMSTHTLAMSQLDGKEHQAVGQQLKSGQTHSPQKPSLIQINKISSPVATKASPTKFV